MEKVIKIRNLDCAVCAAELQEELSELSGIREVSVDFVGQRVKLDAESAEAFAGAVSVISHFEEVEIIDGNAPKKKERHLKELISVAVSTVFFLPALLCDILLGERGEIAAFLLYLCAFAAAGWSVVWSVGKNIVRLFRQKHGTFGVLFDENLLMLVASVGAFCIGQSMEGAAVMLLYQIGEYLQALAVGSSRGEIEKLMEMKSESAILLDGETQTEIPPEELREGDFILLRKGDRVPVDCLLEEGRTELDTKTLTGEAYLREVEAGEEMLAGCVNEGTAVRARVVRPYSDSAVAKILDLVENSTAQKAAPEKFITRFARWYTPVVVLLALILAVVPPLFLDGDFLPWITRALNLLVISCPCALIISVPLTYFSGVGTLARYGVLAKGAVYLDPLAKVKVAAFDKTGTLTEGKFSLAEVRGEPRAAELAAALERNSSHPLAQAFLSVSTSLRAEQCEELLGLGLTALVEGKRVFVGSARLMREQRIEFEEPDTPCGVIYVAEEGRLVGIVLIEDRIRADAASALAELKRAGVERTVVLTGDSERRTRAVLENLPIDVICSQLLPDQKPQRARALKGDGGLLYVGDGINDTPMMAESDVSVAMGGLGSDAAIEASDLVLASDNLSALPKALKAAKKTRKIVAQNIVFSLAVKFLLMVLSLFDLIPLVAAVFGDVGVMLLAVLNAMRMRGKIR